MALITSFEKQPERDRQSVHEGIPAHYSVIEKDGKVFVQIDTYGRDSRQEPGKVSQSIQLDRGGAEQLISILKNAFRI